MNDTKAAAAYHPGDAAVTRSDLDALIAEARQDAEGKGGARAGLIRRLVDALAAERARADQAEAKLATVAIWRHDWLAPPESPAYPHRSKVYVRRLDEILSAAATAEQ